MGVGDKVVVLQRSGKPGSRAPSITTNAGVGDNVLVRQVAGKSPMITPSNGGVGDRIVVTHLHGKQRIVIGGCPGVLGSAARYWHYGNPPVWYPTDPPDPDWDETDNTFFIHSPEFSMANNCWAREGCTLRGVLPVGFSGMNLYYIWDPNYDKVSFDWKLTGSGSYPACNFGILWNPGDPENWNHVEYGYVFLTPADGEWHAFSHTFVNYPDPNLYWYILWAVTIYPGHPYTESVDFSIRNIVFE